MAMLKYYTYTLTIVIFFIGAIFLFFNKADFFAALIATIIYIFIVLLINLSYIKSDEKLLEQSKKYYNKRWLLITILFLLILSTVYAIYSKKFLEIHFGGGGIIDFSNVEDKNMVLFFILTLVFQINLILLILLRIKKLSTIKN